MMFPRAALALLAPTILVALAALVSCPVCAADAPDSTRSRPGYSISSIHDAGRPRATSGTKAAALWLEGGFSSSLGHGQPWKPNGYALDAGIEFHHALAPVVAFGFEHHPSAPNDGPIESCFVGYPPLRHTGGGNHKVFVTSFGLRLRVPAARLEAALEGGLGLAWVSWRYPRTVDAATGAEVFPAYRSSWTGVMAEYGISLRTRTGRPIDYTFGIRHRGYGEVSFESDYSGSSFDVRLGILAR